MPRKPKPPPPPEPKRHERGWHDGSVVEARPGRFRAFRPRVKNGDGTSSRPSRTFDSREQAEQWARGDVQPDVLLLGHWLDRWLSLRLPTVATNTGNLYRRAIMACAPLAARPLASLTVADWQALTNELLARWSRYHVLVWRGTIKGAIADAIPDHLADNPLARVRLPKPDEQPPKAWTQQEVDRLLSVAAGGTHEPWLLFCLGTGVRLGESRALTWADVDLANGTATIRASLDNSRSTVGPTKTRRVRVVDIPEDVVRVLAEHRKRQRASERYVFGHDGRAYRPRTYRSWLDVRCRAAGVPSLPVHSLRHTCASLALDAGVPVQDVARQLGHSVQTCQKVYAHFIGQGQRRAANALGAAIRHRFSGPKPLDGTRMAPG